MVWEQEMYNQLTRLTSFPGNVHEYNQLMTCLKICIAKYVYNYDYVIRHLW